MQVVKHEVERRADIGSWRIVIYGPHRIYQLVLSNNQYRRYLEWQAGTKLIQDALPDLSDDQRELLMTGLDPAEWDAMWGDNKHAIRAHETYDSNDDVNKSFEEVYRVIRARMAAGGQGWEPK